MLAIEVAGLEDVRSIVDTFLLCFNDDYFAELFPPTEAGVKYLHGAWSSFVKEESAGVFILKDENGNAVSVVLCFEQPGGKAPRAWTTRWPAAQDGMNGPMLEEFFCGMDGQHHQVMGHKQHTYIEVVFTRPSHRRQGYATRLILHVAELVGAIQPLYLDSRPYAVKIYEKLGFVKQECNLRGGMVPMIRPMKQ